MDLKIIIKSFFEHLIIEEIEIYNEISFQLELAIYLRKNYPSFKILLERNTEYWNIDKNIKKEIDIVIQSDDNSKIAIELKYPVNGQYPEQMYLFITDISFCEYLVNNGFDKCYCITLVNDRLFYSGKSSQNIYKYFRDSKVLHGIVYKPTGRNKNDHFQTIHGRYQINWKPCLGSQHKYYILEIPNN